MKNADGQDTLKPLGVVGAGPSGLSAGKPACPSEARLSSRSSTWSWQLDPNPSPDFEPTPLPIRAPTVPTPLGISPHSGGPREVAWLAAPVVLQMSAETVLQIVNSAFVGRLGATELGAVGFGGIWMWTLMSLFFGCATGVQVFVAQEDGAGRGRSSGRWIWHAAYALIPTAIVACAVVGLGFATLLAVIAPSPELQAQTALYVYARLPGIPILVVAGIVTAYYRGLGNTRTPAIVMMASLVVHVVCAYGLIFGEFGLPEWGIFGAGVAIVLSEAVYAGVLVALAARRHHRRAHGTGPVRPSLRESLRFLRTSAPIGGQWLLDMTSFALFTSIVARMGDIEMAASQAMLQLLSLSYMQASAIGVAAGTLVGRYIGSRQLDAAARSYRSALTLVIGLGLTIGVLFLGLPEVLMRIFTQDVQVLELARPLLVLGAFFQFIDAVGIVTSGSLRGGGDTRWPFLLHATLAWALRLPLVWLAAIVLEGGLLGAWIGECGYILVLAVAFVWRFRSGRWRTIQI